MPNTVGNLLRAARRSMQEMIVPAVGPENPLAKEQAQLIVMALQFVEDRLPHLHSRDRAEMIAYADMAEAVLATAHIEAERALLADVPLAIGEARRLQASPGASSVEMQVAAQKIAAAVSAGVRAARQSTPELLQRLHDAVAAGSRPIIDLQRAFFAPTGFDRGAKQLPSLEEMIETLSAPHDERGEVERKSA